MKENRIGISKNKISFEDIYLGKCNGISFNLVYRGTINDFSDELDTSIEILWDIEPERAKELEEGIRKLFRNRLENEGS